MGQMSRNQTEQMNNVMRQQVSLAQQLSLEEFIQQFELQSLNSRQYMLSFISHNKIYGELSASPKKITTCPTKTRFPIWLEGYDEIRLVSGCSQNINQGQLIIATDDESLYDLKKQFISASLIALLSAVFLGLITGLIFSFRILKRINSFNGVAQRVESGELNARIPISAHNDEYDHMAVHINTMLTRLEDSFHSIANITDMIAHDLRTPLGHLRQQIEQQLLATKQQDNKYESLQDMLIKLDQILFTFSSMLELSRLEQDSKSNHFKNISINNIIEDALDLIQPLCEERQQTITISKNQQLTIKGDATLLFRAIYNLLENASKYAGENAEITISCGKQGFIICDNGPGISDLEKEKVFQRLYRIDKSRNIPGFGLGLSLVKAIVELHKAEIRLFDNNPGLKVSVLFKDRS